MALPRCLQSANFAEGSITSHGPRSFFSGLAEVDDAGRADRGAAGTLAAMAVVPTSTATDDREFQRDMQRAIAQSIKDEHYDAYM
jgi:hypothetical protein